MKKNQGFTLIEMSVVVVIIALLAGAVLVGRDIIKGAEVRAIVGEYDRYAKSIKEFQDKYQALPGDMNNAQSIWGAKVCTGSLAPTATSFPNLFISTCNGNGNGRVGSCTEAMKCCADPINCDGNVDSVGEIWLLWQHLSNAGLIDGLYTGAPTSNTNANRAVLRLNVPASSRTPLGWTVAYYVNPNDWAGANGGRYGHIMMLGGVDGREGGQPRFTTGSVLPVHQAMELDKKIDDGRPLTGNVRAWNNYFSAGDPLYCVDNNEYSAITSDQPYYECGMYFIMKF